MYSIGFEKEAFTKAISLIGGMSKLARAAGISYQTILNWKSDRSGMSPESAEKIGKVLEPQITRESLMPDFPWEAWDKARKK